MIDPAWGGAAVRRDDERHPSVGTCGGVPWLAYLARVRGEDGWELWASPLDREPSGWPPRRAALARSQAGGGVRVRDAGVLARWPLGPCGGPGRGEAGDFPTRFAVDSRWMPGRIERANPQGAQRGRRPRAVQSAVPTSDRVCNAIVLRSSRLGRRMNMPTKTWACHPPPPAGSPDHLEAALVDLGSRRGTRRRRGPRQTAVDAP